MDFSLVGITLTTSKAVQRAISKALNLCTKGGWSQRLERRAATRNAPADIKALQDSVKQLERRNDQLSMELHLALYILNRELKWSEQLAEDSSGTPIVRSWLTPRQPERGQGHDDHWEGMRDRFRQCFH